MTQKRIVSWSIVAAIGLLSPLSVWAFGLGQIAVNSALNQPFEAEIPITALRATERGNLDVRLASASDFDRAGLERSLLLTQLRFEVIEQGDSARVKITSQVPIKEPFLDFLVTASAGEGRMLREYTVLLDPPAEIFQRSRETIVSPSKPSTPPVGMPVTQPSMSAKSYRVRSGDTLWQIAEQTRPMDDITVQQMMMAFLAANPDAFQQNNINALKADVTLQVPGAATIRQLSVAEALDAVQQQTRQWQNRNQVAVESPVATQQSADVSSVETLADQAEVATESTKESVAVTEIDAIVQKEQVDDASRLQLVAAAEDGNTSADPTQIGDPEIQQLNEQLTLAQETIEAQNQENIDFKSRMDAMEEQLETMRRLLSLKDEDMARLQSMLEQEPLSDTEVMPLTSLENDVDVLPAEQQDNIMDADPALVNSDVVMDDAESSQKPAVANYFDAAKAFVNKYTMEMLLAGLLLLLLIWLFLRHSRQEQTWDEAISKVSDDEHDKPVDLADPASNETVAPEVTELETTNIQPEKTVDQLVEQADMFVGYADYVQARNALEQAYHAAPDNKAVAAKLLFVLFKQNKVSEFNNLLADSDINDSDMQWVDVRIWAQALMPDDARFKEPQHPIESNSNEAPDAMPKASGDGQQVSTESESNYEEVSAIDFNVSDYQDAGHDLDEIQIPEESTETDALTETDSVKSQFNETVTENDLEPIQLDVDLNDDLNDWQAEQSNSPLSDSAKPISLDLDIDEDDAVSDFDSDAEKARIPELDVDDAPDDLDFDLSGFDEVDEAETKLDLAAAYVDMGDPDGARGILQEVLSEGTEEQKQRAQTLLDSLN